MINNLPRSEQKQYTSAILQATAMICKEVKESKQIPFVCKNIMQAVIQHHMGVLANSIGTIELAARRADAYGVAILEGDEPATCRDKEISRAETLKRGKIAREEAAREAAAEMESER